MKWTTDKPTIAGWYWYRGDYDASSMDIQPVVVYVSGDGEAWQPFMDYADPLERLPGEWFGPIEEPA